MNNHKTWETALKKIKSSKSFKETISFVDFEIKKGKEIYPLKENIFNAFKLTDFDKVKVVILGQDPYHGCDNNIIQANGLAFSVNKNVKIPPSLVNIYKEIKTDLEIKPPNDGDLTYLAKQGVFLLNAVLTVEKSQPNSHKNKGWEEFTDSVIKLLSKEKEHLVFILWGANAQKKSKLIDKKHTILKAPHPSPLSVYRGFWGCKHFSKTNFALEKNNQSPINWSNE